MAIPDEGARLTDDWSRMQHGRRACYLSTRPGFKRESGSRLGGPRDSRGQYT